MAELTVVCVKAKPAYGTHYVNRLHRMVERHLDLPHRFVCLTDDKSGVRCETLRLPRGLKGWWAKLALFKQEFEGTVLYLDLDTIIIDRLEFITEYDGDFAILRDFYRPDGYGSGVMLWNKPHPEIWEEWIRDGKPEHGLGDQGWMEHIVEADLLQDVFPGRFCSFKADCEDGVPEEASVVCFHGYPKPHDLESDHWARRIWEGEEPTAWVVDGPSLSI